MEAQSRPSDWIDAYLEWSATDAAAAAPPPARAMDCKGSEEIAAAYLEWMDGAQPDVSREAILLTALRAEADCVQVLRQLLERALAGQTQAPQLAADFPRALAIIAADVGELRGKVQAMQLH